MSERDTVWVLQTSKGGCLGVYTSMKCLSDGVDYWMKESPRDTLSWLEYELNYSPEALSWEWAYIPLGSRTKRLSHGGGMVPLKKYWGHNLVDLSNRGIRFYSDEEDALRNLGPPTGGAVLVPNQP